MWEDILARGRGAGLGAGRGVTEEDAGVSGSDTEVFGSVLEEEASFLDRQSFLSSETFPIWIGNVSVTSGDFKQTFT